MADINDYRDFLLKLAEEESDEFINNSSPDHAAVMIEVLFCKADKKVCILSDHLNPNVYNRPGLKKAVCEFLKKNDSKLDIILQLQEQDRVLPSENRFLSSLEGFKEKISLRRASEEIKKLKNHFMVTMTPKGNHALRFETDLHNKIATGTFNAGPSGKKLMDVYEQRWSIDCVEIQKNEIWPEAVNSTQN